MNWDNVHNSISQYRHGDLNNPDNFSKVTGDDEQTGYIYFYKACHGYNNNLRLFNREFSLDITGKKRCVAAWRSHPNDCNNGACVGNNNQGPHESLAKCGSLDWKGQIFTAVPAHGVARGFYLRLKDPANHYMKMTGNAYTTNSEATKKAEDDAWKKKAPKDQVFHFVGDNVIRHYPHGDPGYVFISMNHEEPHTNHQQGPSGDEFRIKLATLNTQYHHCIGGYDGKRWGIRHINEGHTDPAILMHSNHNTEGNGKHMKWRHGGIWLGEQHLGDDAAPDNFDSLNDTLQIDRQKIAFNDITVDKGYFYMEEPGGKLIDVKQGSGALQLVNKQCYLVFYDNVHGNGYCFLEEHDKLKYKKYVTCCNVNGHPKVSVTKPSSPFTILADIYSPNRIYFKRGDGDGRLTFRNGANVFEFSHIDSATKKFRLKFVLSGSYLITSALHNPGTQEGFKKKAFEATCSSNNKYLQAVVENHTNSTCGDLLGQEESNKLLRAKCEANRKDPSCACFNASTLASDCKDDQNKDLPGCKEYVLELKKFTDGITNSNLSKKKKEALETQISSALTPICITNTCKEVSDSLTLGGASQCSRAINIQQCINSLDIKTNKANKQDIEQKCELTIEEDYSDDDSDSGSDGSGSDDEGEGFKPGKWIEENQGIAIGIAIFLFVIFVLIAVL